MNYALVAPVKNLKSVTEHRDKAIMKIIIVGYSKFRKNYRF
ncbi:MAG: hypothetical protein KatS3mg098_274 [Candidatus Parcubacteria bacterium]|nr:MAG: hypothetical protein KatS3mg098_274 [Candidatus Parcubacteria bacterium]